MPILDIPEGHDMDQARDRLKSALRRLTNELPTIAAGLAAVLYVVGLDLDLTQVVERAEGIIAFAVWLLARQSIDGPVTLIEQRSGRTLWTARQPPEDA